MSLSIGSLNASESSVFMNSTQLPIAQTTETVNRELDKEKESETESTTQKINSLMLFACNFPGCNKVYNKNYTLNRHKKLHLPSNELSHICDWCNKFFSERSSLLRHEKSHNGFKPYQCPDNTCMKRFIEKSNLNTHIKTVHKKNPPIPSKTKVLQKHTSKEVHLSTIIPLHPENRNTSDSEGSNNGAVFLSDLGTSDPLDSSNTTLENAFKNGPMSNETGGPNITQKRKIVNLELGKEKESQIQGVSKRIKHNKPFACDFPGCEKGYVKRDTLNRHKRIHYPVKDPSLICRWCPKFFLYKADLSRHELSHSGVKPSPCPLVDTCGKRFGDKYSLKKHINSQHPGIIWTSNFKDNLPPSTLSEVAVLQSHPSKKAIPDEVQLFADGIDSLLNLNRISILPPTQEKRDTSGNEGVNRALSLPDSHSTVSSSSSSSSSSNGSHSFGIKPYICPVGTCGKRFQNTWNLNAHLNSKKHPKFVIANLQKSKN